MAEDYRNAFQALDAARQHYAMVSQEMAGLRQRQAELVQMPPAPPPFEQTISRASSLRQQRRTPSGPVTTNASSSSGFPVTSAPSFSNGIPNLSPSFPPSTSPFFNYSNGMTVLPRQPMDQGGSGMSSADVEALTAGAPLSPGVGAELLPAGLLSNVDEDSPPSLQPSAEFRSRASDDGSSEGRHASNANILPGLGPIPGLGMIPGLGAPQTLEMAPPPGPTSPGSASSRSPSVFASPQASTNNLTFSPQNILDSDRQSIRSIRSNRAASGSAAQSGSRFTQILGLDKFANRPRGKTMSEEGPTLGTLSKTQSQSMPRGTPEETETGSPGIGRRRNSSHSGNFFGSILNRNASTRSSGAESSANKNIAVRRRAYNMFGGTKLDGWPAILGGDRPASPRPGSTHSIELPRPSQDSTNWGFGPWNEPFGQRSSPLSADWGMPQPNPIGPSRTWGSRHPSRRPSTQHGASGVAYDIMEDDVDDPDILPPNPPAQAPIGTKPAQPKESPQPAKLNPTAKSFSLFSRGSDKKAKNKDKDTSVAEEASSSRTTPITVTEDTATPTSPPLRGPEYDFSPPQSRKSRDTRSVTTADSSLHEYSSRTSLDRSASYTPSEAQTPSSASGKETFMQKLTRKSSSGKFGLPVFNRDKKQRFKGSENEGAVGEEGEGEMNTSVGSLATPGREEGRDRRDKEKREGRSWSSVFTGKMGKKDKANETPSLSGASLASETEEGWDE
ncbi:hypothetical protein H2203_000537 [Taxawa tesnikishii (nom. ined.)]|nr:hypothetical protein H2203_000537 [Dothideales sp. JES 119]